MGLFSAEEKRRIRVAEPVLGNVGGQKVDLVAIVERFESTAGGKGASLIGVEDVDSDFVAVSVEGVLAEIGDDLLAISAVETDWKEWIPAVGGALGIAGTWTASEASNVPSLDRTAAASDGKLGFDISGMSRIAASKGRKLTSYQLVYSVTTAAPVLIRASLVQWRKVM